MRYIKIINWDKFQHYSHRNPPWIKLHKDLLNDYKFSCLQDASKLHLMLIWLLASQMDNLIPDDEVWIQQKLCLNEKVDIKTLIKHWFIEYSSDMLATCKQSATTETETETEAKSETEKRKKKPSRFAPPSIEEIKSVIIEKNYTVNPDVFFNHYEANGWMVGKNKMKSWTAALASWNGREKSTGKKGTTDAIDRFLSEEPLQGEYHVVK